MAPRTKAAPLPVGTLGLAESNDEIVLALDHLAREGALRMIGTALRAKTDEHVARLAQDLDEDGQAIVRVVD